MAKPSLQFDIHGLPLQVVANHSLLSSMIADELKAFQTKKKSARSGIQLICSTLPSHPGYTPYPARYMEYREISKPFGAPDTLVSHYVRSLITVITDLRKRRIQVAAGPEPSLFPDPAYHLCLTQPLDPWLKQKGLFFLHAGCVAEKGQGILIIGHSQAGKSTLTLSAIRGGFKFLSDEQPLLSFKNGRLRVHAFPRRVRLDRSVAEIFSELRPVLDSSASERLVFHAQEIWEGCLVSSCLPKLLIFPQFKTRGRLRLRQMHPSLAFAKLFEDDHFVWYKNGRWNQLSHRHLALFERLTKKTTAFRLEYGTNDILQIPSVFRRLLRG